MASCNNTNIVRKGYISDAEPFFEMNGINAIVKPNLNPLTCISYNMHGFNQERFFWNQLEWNGSSPYYSRQEKMKSLCADLALDMLV